MLIYLIYICILSNLGGYPSVVPNGHGATSNGKCYTLHLFVSVV